MISLIKRLRLRIKDMSTISTLFQLAEKYAEKRGEGLPAEEHFLLSALDLPDGTARRVFERAGVESDQLEKALDQQHKEALSYVGVTPLADEENNDLDNESPASAPFKAKPTAQSLMQELVKKRKEDKDIPLLGLHVIDVLSEKELGVVARTLKLLGLNQSSLKKAVAQELENYRLSAQ